ncbi:hypothetical protein [Saccharopolyspora hattusasensis]|uniref:hypothetical protein n=1 Tax=Saccharopolyspora hattusasensis TaxID=1128679 RepID=UPI003D99A2A2
MTPELAHLSSDLKAGSPTASRWPGTPTFRRSPRFAGCTGDVAQQQARPQQAEHAHARSGETDADQRGQPGHGDRPDRLPEVRGEPPGAEERCRTRLRRQVRAERRSGVIAGVRDARRLSPGVQEDLRRRVVAAVHGG